MKNIPHSILTFDRLDESKKTNLVKQLAKNIQLTNDYIHDLEQKLLSGPNEKTQNNLEALRILMKNQEKEFFDNIMKPKKINKMTENKKRPVGRPKSKSEMLKRVSKKIDKLSREITLKPITDEQYLKSEVSKKYNDIGFESLPKYPTPDRFKESDGLGWKSIIGLHIYQLLVFYFIVAFCLWDFNPGNWNAGFRYGIIIASYILTNLVIVFRKDINRFYENMAKRLF